MLVGVDACWRWLPARCGVLALAGVLCACGQAPVLEAYRGDAPARVELSDTAFFPQQAYQCGPAALATVLSSSATPVDVDALVDEVYLPARRGSLQPELLAATRRRARVAWTLEQGYAELLAELAQGRPVLVLQKLGIGPWPGWHYAVVIGYDAARNEILLRSGEDARLVLSVRRFERTWRTAGRWGFVALEPGQLPARAEPARYARAVATLESAAASDDQLAAAERAYRAGLARWPGDVLLGFALANTLYARGEREAAESAYRAVLAHAPDHLPSRNNLAQTLLERGCADRALQVLGDIEAHDGPYASELAETYRAARAAAGRDCRDDDCPVSLATRCAAHPAPTEEK